MIIFDVSEHGEKDGAITVKELIEVLLTYSPEDKVFAEWDGSPSAIKKENIEGK